MNDAVSPDGASAEAALAAEIERLKAQFSKTRELYREVCALLFFGFGITPTANRLYQLVKRGSMGTPTEVLAEFWRTLREKSRVRIEHPDLPTELQAATGELAAALWTRAVDMAQEQLSATRHEMQLAVADAQVRQAQSETERDRLRQELVGSAAALERAQARITEQDQALAISAAPSEALQAQLRASHHGAQQLQQALETARRDFASELDKLRADGALAQERLKAAETRALLEIERERQAAARLHKELDSATRKAEQGANRHRDDVHKLLAQLGDLRQQVGALEGNVDALRVANARYIEDATQAREQRDHLASSLAHFSVQAKTPTQKASGSSAAKAQRKRKT
jgi:chromosome segregation ATPase